MVFTEIIEAVAKRTRKPKTHVYEILSAFQEEVLKALAQGERITLPGLGVFYPLETRKRPLFGGTRMSEGGSKVRFRPSRSLALEKYGVVLDDQKTKTAGVERKCPQCGREQLKDIRDWCPDCGTKPFEKRPEPAK